MWFARSRTHGSTDSSCRLSPLQAEPVIAMFRCAVAYFFRSASEPPSRLYNILPTSGRGENYRRRTVRLSSFEFGHVMPHDLTFILKCALSLFSLFLFLLSHRLVVPRSSIVVVRSVLFSLLFLCNNVCKHVICIVAILHIGYLLTLEIVAAHFKWVQRCVRYARQQGMLLHRSQTP